MVEVVSPSRRADAAAIAIILAAVICQLISIDYGTRINDVPYVADYKAAAGLSSSAAMSRNVVIGGAASSEREQPDLWATRFKLYSVEADEIVNIIALARINQHRMNPDPGFYLYGGAYLYPLGAWYFALTKAGVLDIRDLPGLLAAPQRMDRVWIFGRLLTLCAFAASAVFLFLALRRVTSTALSLILLTLYLLCPGSVLFSQIMKPHWYALAWVNLALYAMVRAYVDKNVSRRRQIILGVALGLAVGSVVTFALFAFFCWCALFLLVRRGDAPKTSLFSTPAIALLVFAISNPYYLLNWKNVAAERAAAENWYQPSITVSSFLAFIDNSLLTSLGLALAIVLGACVAVAIVRPKSSYQRLYALAIVLALIAGSMATSSMAHWHSNIRYVCYALPAGLLFLAAYDWPYRTRVLAAALVLTAAQAVPLRLAYLDENDAVHSTRLAAASWIDTNIPAGEAVCVGTVGPAPYDVPPFRFDRYALNKPGCRWRVLIERETDAVQHIAGDHLVHRFRPRLSPETFPLVIGHINPQVSIYRVTAPTLTSSRQGS